MSREPEPENSLLPLLPSEHMHPVRMALPVELQRALVILVADFSYTSFARVQTAYSNALLACRGRQCFELAQATIDRYLELTAALYRKYNALVESFTYTLCVYWERGSIRNAMVTNMTICGAVHFARLLQDCMQGREEVEYALRAALNEGRALYIKWFCTVVSDFTDLSQIVVNAVWTVRHDRLHVLKRHCHCCSRLSSELTKIYLVETLSRTSSWMEPDPDYDMGSLTTWLLWHFLGFQHGDVCLKLTQRQKELLPDFVNFCTHRRACVVAIFMAAMAENWPLVMAVLRLRPEELQHPSFPLSEILLFMLRKAPLDIMVETSLAVIDGSALSTLKFDSRALSTQYLVDMSNLCLTSDRRNWAMFFMLQTRAWAQVLAKVTPVKDSETADIVLVNAARYSRWNVVDTLLPHSSSDAAVLSYIFQRAAVDCKIDVVERLLPHVDLGLLPFVHGDEEGPLAIFRTLLDFAKHDDAITKVRIVLLLVRQGLASHVRHGEKVVEDAIEQSMPTVAHLLLDVGMVTKDQFRKALKNVQTRNYLSFPLELDQAVQRMIEDGSLDRPLTLQESCRLALSHQVGFGPERQQKIEHLAVPRRLKDLVALTDLIEPVEAMIEKGLDATDCF